MIRFEHLYAGYDGSEVLKDVSLTIPSGGLTVLIGPNGCGKTTLLKVCAGILRPKSGSISVLGVNPGSISPRALAKSVSYLPQTRPIPEMTVLQLAVHGRYPHIRWGSALSESDRDIVRRALETAGAIGFQDKRLDRLSGGERQRAYLAMMLSQQTPVMLMDEPSAYLDLKAQFDLLALIRNLAAEGRTVLAVLHDLALAFEYADRIVLMDKGRIIKTGTPDEILASGLLESVFGIRPEYGKEMYRLRPVQE